MDLTIFFLFIAGLTFMIVGADILVRGASKLAAIAGISPLIIGLTIVAFGTSSPELAVSLQSALNGQTDISLGNVVGSNIFNVLFILGLSALITPLVISHQLIKLDVPIMIGVSILTLVLGVDGKFGRIDGILLFSGILMYTFFLIRQSRKEKKVVQDVYIEQHKKYQFKIAQHWSFNIVLIIAGLVLLVFGSNWLVDGAIVIARTIGVSELIIGLTIVAVGTSLPEVATSVVASIRGERDIAVGNVVGSNIFNILSVLGISAIFAPGGLPVSDAALRLDIPVMIAVAIACLPIFFTGHLISRWEGGLFLGYYIAYTVFIILDSTQHQVLPVFSMVMLEFVVPITVITLITVLVRSIRSQRRMSKNH